MGFKMGVAGCGGFGSCFVPLYKAHPLVDEVVIAYLVPERVENFSKKYGVERTCNSLDELLKTDVDAVAIITQRQLHGPMVIQALKAGKHVYSAVPMAIDIEDVREIIRLVKETGLIYMVGETSYYYPETILLVDVSDQITLGKCARPAEMGEVSEEYMKTDFFSGVAPVHNIGRLPKNFGHRTLPHPCGP